MSDLHSGESVDRRQFLKTTSAGAAASAALYAAQAHAGAAKHSSPNDKIELAVMGTNGRGSGLIRDFLAAGGAHIRYVCDVDGQALEKGIAAAAAKQSDEPRRIADFRRALDDPQLDALVIAAPDHWHAPATILACAAGKHVYVEKPACHNPAEGELMVAAARQHDRIVQMGNQRRSSQGVAEAVARLHEGEIGRVLFARGWITSARPNIGYGKPAAVPAHLDYDLWQGPAPEVPYRDNVIHYHWHWFWDWGTGEIGNNGIHAVDVARWGLDVDYPESVTCSGGKFFFDDDQQTPDTQLATFHFGDKAITWEHRTWNPRGFEGSSFGISFYGEQGVLVIESGRYVVYDSKGKVVDEATIDRGDVTHQQNFFAALRGEGELNSEIAEGVKSTLLCLLGNVAYRSGRTLRFDTTNRRIVGDTEQQALWGRQYRDGWQPTV